MERKQLSERDARIIQDLRLHKIIVTLIDRIDTLEAQVDRLETTINEMQAHEPRING